MLKKKPRTIYFSFFLNKRVSLQYSFPLIFVSFSLPILLVPELHNLQSVQKLKHENFLSNKSSYHREKFTKLKFRALALRQSE